MLISNVLNQHVFVPLKNSKNRGGIKSQYTTRVKITGAGKYHILIKRGQKIIYGISFSGVLSYYQNNDRDQY